MPASLGAVLRRPLFERQPTLHEERSALAHILVERLGGPTEGTAVNKAHFLFALAFFARPFAVYRQTELNNRRLTGQIRQLRVPRQVAHQHYLIKIRH
jgi:hypothetical protein